MTDKEYKQKKRDCDRLKIAAMAMQGILSDINMFKTVLQVGEEILSGENIAYRAVTKASFAFADYLIAEANLPIKHPDNEKTDPNPPRPACPDAGGVREHSSKCSIAAEHKQPTSEPPMYESNLL